jgi:hypothetical protein
MNLEIFPRFYAAGISKLIDQLWVLQQTFYSADLNIYNVGSPAKKKKN